MLLQVGEGSDVYAHVSGLATCTGGLGHKSITTFCGQAPCESSGQFKHTLTLGQFAFALVDLCRCSEGLYYSISFFVYRCVCAWVRVWVRGCACMFVTERENE